MIGNVLLPFIFWMLKREDVNGINKHGKDILNGQLTYSIAIGSLIGIFFGLLLIPAIFPGNAVFAQAFFVHFPMYLILYMCFVFLVFGIFPAVNAMRVYRGKQAWKYPLKINFFR